MSRPETDAIRIQSNRSKYNEHSVPLYLTSSYVFEDAEDMRSQFADEKEGLIYSRKWMGDRYWNGFCFYFFRRDFVLR